MVGAFYDFVCYCFCLCEFGALSERVYPPVFIQFLEMLLKTIISSKVRFVHYNTVRSAQKNHILAFVYLTNN